MSGDQSRRALLVEDEALVSMVAEENLRDLGFEPDCVSSGADALLILSGEHVLAVIDVGLPDVRGDQLARQIRLRQPEIKIIMASGYDPVALRRDLEDHDGLQVIGKPYSEDDMARAVEALGLSLP